jgi:hypothetical protein
MNYVLQPLVVHRMETVRKKVNSIIQKTNVILYFCVLESVLDREMVHALTWLPIKMFTTSVMEGAVDCWCWAIIGRPELELLVNTDLFFFSKNSLF